MKCYYRNYPIQLILVFVFYLLSISVAFGMPPKRARAEGAAHVSAAADPDEEYVDDVEGGGGGAAAEPFGESTDIIKKRIERLSVRIGNGLGLSKYVKDEKLRGMLVGLLEGLDKNLDELIKFGDNPGRLDHITHNREMQRKWCNIDKVFTQGAGEILGRAEDDGMVRDIINVDLGPCFVRDFESILDLGVLKRTALEKELVSVLAGIPKLPKKPTCFISYAWGNPGHVDWVFDFYKHLVAAGLDAHIDRVNNESGSISAYISNIETDDHILVIGTPELRQKYEAHRQTGGGPIVGTELQMIHNRFMRKNDSVIKMILAGAGAAYADCFTPILGGDVAAYDFRGASEKDYYENLFKVIKKLYQVDPQVAGVMEQIETIKEEFMKKVDRMLNRAKTPGDIQRIASEWEAIRLQQEKAKKKGLA